MVKQIGRNIKGYLSLLWGKPPGPPTEKYTLSTKGADEGALAEKQDKAPGRLCRNCGGALQGKFCHRCGQKDADYRRPYWTFVEDFTDDIISRDSRLWRTLAYIMFMPGAMTREYVAGRRARFLPPIRFFFVTILLFFFTISVLNVAIVKFSATPVTAEERKANLDEALAELDEKIAALEAEQAPDAALEAARDRRQDVLDDLGDLRLTLTRRAEGETTEGEAMSEEAQKLDIILKYDYDIKMFSPITAEDQPLPEEVLEELVFMDEQEEGGSADQDEWDQLGRKIQQGLRNAAQDPTRLNNSLNDWVPVIMGVFVPMFALFLRFFYWKRELFLYNHLVFSLHFHTYLFLVLIFFLLAQYFLGSAVTTWLFVAAVPLYLLVALKVASGQGWFRTLFKFSVIAVFYVIGFSLMLSAAFLLGLAET